MAVPLYFLVSRPSCSGTAGTRDCWAGVGACSGTAGIRDCWAGVGCGGDALGCAKSADLSLFGFDQRAHGVRCIITCVSSSAVQSCKIQANCCARGSSVTTGDHPVVTCHCCWQPSVQPVCKVNNPALAAHMFVFAGQRPPEGCLDVMSGTRSQAVLSVQTAILLAFTASAWMPMDLSCVVCWQAGWGSLHRGQQGLLYQLARNVGCALQTLCHM